MARLRKPSTLDTPAPVLMPPPPPTTTSKPARTSPRKTNPTLRETPSKRSLRYNSDQDDEPSILIPKVQANAGETPKQRIRVLRPVASNSRLLRRLSGESVRSPEKRTVRGRDLDGGSRYSRDLARVVGRRGKSGRIEGKIDMEKEVDGESAIDMKRLAEKMERTFVETETEVGTQIEETLNEEEELDQSLLCGDEEDIEEAVVLDAEEDEELEVVSKELVETEAEKEDEEDDDDDDDDPVVTNRSPRKVLRRRIVESDTEDEDEDDDPIVVNTNRNRQVPLQAQAKTVEPEPDLAPLTSTRPPFRKGHSAISNWAQEVIDLTESPEPSESFVLPVVPSRLPLAQPLLPSVSTSRPTSSGSSDVDALLHFSPTPTKQRSPRKAPPVARPCTPPAAPPSPTKLVSPSKKKPRIPPAPALRPSLDAFWAPEVVNEWNDKHSPSKPLLSPKKEKWLQSLEKQDLGLLSDSDVSFASPPISPRKKNALASPVKGETDSPTVAQIRAQRKAFSESKHALAESFILEVDATITSSRISEMSKQTGGIRLVWSKTLKTTAGRANWRRETFRIRTGPLHTDFREEARHHCSIELAEKVIDDEERLYNVLAHEYCHLTTFMISEQRNNPHGAEFKTWGRKVSAAFAAKGVTVTTKHSYQIEYKYVWRCGVCAYEFKRHSKSVDPAKHSCGRCKGKLVQVKPVPRGAGKGKDGAPKEKSEYQVFVKTNFAKVKKEMQAEGLDVQMGKVMEVVARQYREEKENKAKAVAQEVDDVELAFGGLNIGDD